MPSFWPMQQYHLGVAVEDPQLLFSGENGKHLYRFRVLKECRLVFPQSNFDVLICSTCG